MSRFARLAGFAALAALLTACGEPREEIVLEDVAAGAQPGSQSQSESNAAPSAAPAQAANTGGRQGLRIVGSSTVFPFTTAVAENFGAKTQFPTPVDRTSVV